MYAKPSGKKPTNGSRAWVMEVATVDSYGNILVCQQGTNLDDFCNFVKRGTGAFVFVSTTGLIEHSTATSSDACSEPCTFRNTQQ